MALGLTVDDVAERLLVSAPKVSRIETAQRGISLRDVRDLATVYDLAPDEVDALMRLARDSQRRSSWHQYSSRISDYAELEEAAVAISDFESAAIPALLQSEPYAHALAVGFDLDATDALRHQAVEARLARQRSVLDRRQAFSAVIDEAALRRVVGNTAVMHEQMKVLLDRARHPHVTIQVIPFEAGAHPGMDSTFIILRFTESVSDLVYVEGLIGSVYLKSPADTERYGRVFAHLQTRALSPEQTLDKIESMLKYYAA